MSHAPPQNFRIKKPVLGRLLTKSCCCCEAARSAWEQAAGGPLRGGGRSLRPQAAAARSKEASVAGRHRSLTMLPAHHPLPPPTDMAPACRRPDRGRRSPLLSRLPPLPARAASHLRPALPLCGRRSRAPAHRRPRCGAAPSDAGPQGRPDAPAATCQELRLRRQAVVEERAPGPGEGRPGGCRRLMAEGGGEGGGGRGARGRGLLVSAGGIVWWGG